MKKMLLAAMMLLSMMSMAEERVITVTGKGEIKLRPDVTRLTVEVRSDHATYADAYQIAEVNLKELSSIMSTCGLESTLPKTTYFNIAHRTRPLYDEYRNYLGEEQVGYRLEQNIRIDLGMDNALLTQLIRSIGKQMKDVEISIAFTTSDPRVAQNEMLSQAVQDARTKAELMAEAAGCKLGKVKTIDYNEQPVYLYAQARKFAACNDMVACTEASLDINADDVKASEQVTVVWYLK